MKCVDCLYYYQDESDLFPCCHCDMSEGFAPCEEDDDDGEYENSYGDDSYDYYEGI